MADGWPPGTLDVMSRSIYVAIKIFGIYWLMMEGLIETIHGTLPCQHILVRCLKGLLCNPCAGLHQVE